VNLPNLITMGRILAVPFMIWAIASGQYMIAFLLFLVAGVSDAIDGYLAKHFGMQSQLGAFLDPLADKVLLISIYVALGITEGLPRWIVILVVSRDIMIIGAVMLSWLVGRPIAVKPLMVSKWNTVAQIVLAGLVLASLGLRIDIHIVLNVMMAIVAALTLISAAFYVAEWVRHMGTDARNEPG
jgi:cardiolipin synthase